MATTKTIQSVERAFSILEYLQQCGGGERSVKEIADALELNKSTAFGLINTLTTLGYLQQNADNQKYVLSLKLLSFSNTIKVQNSIIRTVHPLSGADQPEIRRDRPPRRGSRGQRHLCGQGGVQPVAVYQHPDRHQELPPLHRRGQVYSGLYAGG